MKLLSLLLLCAALTSCAASGEEKAEPADTQIPFSSSLNINSPESIPSKFSKTKKAKA